MTFSRLLAPPTTGPTSGSVRAVIGIALVAAVGLGCLAARVPTLRFVDFVPFAARAFRLLHGPAGDAPVLDGGDIVNGLYPIGYPALLCLGHALFGDALVAGKVLAVAAGVAATATVARWCGPVVALWTLAQAAILLYGSTEGTDLPAAACALAALAAASSGRSALAGTLAAGAILLRYTGVAVVPFVLYAAPARPRALLALALGTAPHWALAAWTGASVWPDQSQNLLIAAGHPTTLFSMDTLTRWPGGVWRACSAGVNSWPLALSAVGLAIGVLRRDRRAALLLGYALAHAALLGVAFANPRLALPITLAAAIGAGWLVNPRLLAPCALGLLLATLPPTLASDPVAERGAAASAATSTVAGPCLSTSPWSYQRREGWLFPSIDLSGLRMPDLTPATLHTLAEQEGAACVALDLARTRGAWPGLAPLLTSTPLPGYRRIGEVSGWRIWSVEPYPPPLVAPGVPR